MAKICIVRPPTIMPMGAVTTQQGVPSIGIAYLCSSLKAAGHSVSVVDAFGADIDRFTRIEGTQLLINGLLADEIIERIPLDVDVIGVSCMYSNEWVYARVVINKIILKFPSVPVIGGGEHFTAELEHSFKTCPELHSVVMGEGEETFLDLIDAIQTRRSLETVTGIAFRKNERVCRQPARKRIRAVDNIPEPSWDEMPLETYLEAGLGMSSVRGRNMPMIASRGCPYKCTFCSNPAMWTQLWIPRSPENVIAEIERWLERFRFTHLEFYDLTAIVRKDWIVNFSKLLIERDLGITWSLPSGTRSEALDDEVVPLLKASGCDSLTYAPESGSEATLKRIKKQVNLKKMSASMRASVNAGIEIKANMIVGFPDQTKGEVAESFVFMVRMAWEGVHDVAVFPFVAYPGSALFQKLVLEGKIDRDGQGYDQFLAGNVYNDVSGMKSWSEHISDRMIKWLTVGGMGWFYFFQFLFRPWRLAGSISRILRSRPLTMFDMAIDGILRNFVTKRRKLNVQESVQIPTVDAFP